MYQSSLNIFLHWYIFGFHCLMLHWFYVNETKLVKTHEIVFRFSVLRKVCVFLIKFKTE